MVSTKQISIVINDIDGIVQSSHFHLLLTIQGGPVTEKSFVHFASRAGGNRNLIFASAEGQNAETNGNAKR
jgi:hypothetical protein